MRDLIANLFPSLGIYKRKLAALYDATKATRSYSQHAEDVLIHDLLSRQDRLHGIYIDVGANHPTTISNTYYFYRKGFSGVCIEPNRELANLHRKFRDRDCILEIGVSDYPGVSKFHVSKTPVLSSFKDIKTENLWRTEYIPVLTLDDALRELRPERVFFLSIDTEGFNWQVILGASSTLEITDLVCIEVDNEEDEARISAFLTEQKGFRRIKRIACNILFENTKLK
jgi:FkbM family methyltransferase